MAHQGNYNTTRTREGDFSYAQQMQNSTNQQSAAMAAQLMANNQQAHGRRKGPTQTIWNDGHMVIDDKTYLKSHAMIYNSRGSDMIIEKTSHHSHHHHNRRHHDGHRRHHNHHHDNHNIIHHNQGYCNCGCSDPNHPLNANNVYNTISRPDILLLGEGPGGGNEIVHYQPTNPQPPPLQNALVYQQVAPGYPSTSPYSHPPSSSSSAAAGSSQAMIVTDRYAPRQTDPRCTCRHRNHCTCLHRIETRSRERLLLPAPTHLQPLVVPGRLGLESCRGCSRRAELFTGGYCGDCQVDRGIEVGRREHRSVRYHDGHRGRSRSRSRSVRRRRIIKEVWE